MNDVLLTAEDQRYLQIMEDLNKPRGDGLLVGLKQRLHPKQIECLRSLYIDNKKLVFVPCGRKFGKSEIAGYILWRQALLVPNSVCYYIAPENTHGRKIMWDTQRFQKFMEEDTHKYIDSMNNTEMRIKLKNGSIIQVIGSDNWASANGLTPSIVVYDEFKVFNQKWHNEFDPNRVAKAAPLFVIGTMPKVGDLNKEQYEALLEYAKSDPEGCAVHTYTTWDNPINLIPDRAKAIEKQIDILKARGEDDVIMREYYSIIVPGGSRSVFPMLFPKDHQKSYSYLMSVLSRDVKKLEWFVVCDPGTTTCFAVLFGCINPYTKKVYLLSEIYERDQRQTSTRNVYPRIQRECERLFPGSSLDDDWIKIYDEAAAWFSNEVMDQYGVYFQPTNKVNNKKEMGISLIKDLLIHNFLVISDTCPNLWKEMQEYAKDDKGELSKRTGVYDHLIDCLRYMLAAGGYNMLEYFEKIEDLTPEQELRKDLKTNYSKYEDDHSDDFDDLFDW
jgi:hypothetical protein